MIGRIFSIAVVIAAAYWYWTGPYQAKHHPSYEARLQKNTDDMAMCMRGAAYKAESTGLSEGNAEETCAQRFNLYKDKGKWHSYDEKRREN
ncbi:MAG: hypothetical protein V7700_07265 [Halioglobus sp.]